MGPLGLGLLREGVGAVLDRLFPDPVKRAEAEVQLRKLEAEGTFDQRAERDNALAQLEVNKAELAAGKGGWRTYLGFTLVAAFALQYVVGPLGVWVAAMAGHTVPAPPALDDVLWQLMTAMLGLGGLKTIEKVKGVR